METLGLYKSCADRKALPLAGGVLDQPADLMRWFAVIDKVIEDFRQKRQERETLEKWPTSKQT